MKIPKRLWIFMLIFVVLTFLLSVYGEKFLSGLYISENQYFWILGSFVQGFSAFVGIIVASIALGTNKLFSKKTDIPKLDNALIMPILTSLNTILLSIIGMVFYQPMNEVKAVGVIIILIFLTAVWCIGEIFNLIMKFAFNKLI